MGRYLISEVARMTGVKGHILRRWEEKLPFFAPEKDYQGRRYYGERDMETIVRMKHLVYERGFSEEEAAAQLLADAGAGMARAGQLAALREIREELGKLYLALKKQHRKEQDRKGQDGNDEYDRT